MLQKRQIKELEELINNFSYLAEVGKRMDDYLGYNGNNLKVCALENALDILGYTIKIESRIKSGIKYYYYELVKKNKEK